MTHFEAQGESEDIGSERITSYDLGYIYLSRHHLGVSVTQFLSGEDIESLRSGQHEDDTAGLPSK